MKVVIQRVSSASVLVDGRTVGKIGKGLFILVGVSPEDNRMDIQWIVPKIVNMRIFGDDEGKMNLSLLDCKGQLLIVSQFTLFASTKKGNRPSFMGSAESTLAKELYEMLVEECKKALPNGVETGIFGANMEITLTNEGPVTLTIDTKNKE
jgi:D-tyrosyl-tRNA(Tyr) deacylase